MKVLKGVALLAAFFMAFFAYTGEVIAAGGACHVVDGYNKGKSGTYNGDGDCEGAWGLTECKGNNKCADGAKKIVSGGNKRSGATGKKQ